MVFNVSAVVQEIAHGGAEARPESSDQEAIQALVESREILQALVERWIEVEKTGGMSLQYLREANVDAARASARLARLMKYLARMQAVEVRKEMMQ